MRIGFFCGTFLLAQNLFANPVSLADVAQAMEKLIQEVDGFKRISAEQKQKDLVRMDMLEAQVAELKNRVDEKKLKEAAPFEVGVANDDSNRPLGYQTTGSLNVRSGPSVYAERLYILRPGSNVNVYEIKNEMAFIGDGWCSMKYLVPITSKQKAEHP